MESREEKEADTPEKWFEKEIDPSSGMNQGTTEASQGEGNRVQNFSREDIIRQIEFFTKEAERLTLEGKHLEALNYMRKVAYFEALLKKYSSSSFTSYWLLTTFFRKVWQDQGRPCLVIRNHQVYLRI